MASMATMAATIVGGSAMTKQALTTPSRSIIVAKANNNSNVEMKKEESNNGRRDLVFAGVAAAALSIAKVAMADEPRRGSPEAKKKYAPICVTMPTARICRN